MFFHIWTQTKIMCRIGTSIWTTLGRTETFQWRVSLVWWLFLLVVVVPIFHFQPIFIHRPLSSSVFIRCLSFHLRCQWIRLKVDLKHLCQNLWSKHRPYTDMVYGLKLTWNKQMFDSLWESFRARWKRLVFLISIQKLILKLHKWLKCLEKWTTMTNGVDMYLRNFYFVLQALIYWVQNESNQIGFLSGIPEIGMRHGMKTCHIEYSSK